MVVSKLIVIFCLLQPHLFGVNGQGEVGKFTVEGKLVLPKSGDYDVIPQNSCIRMSVIDAIQCGGIYCNIPQRGSLVLKDFTVVNNEIAYKIYGKGGFGHYYVSVTFNVGWCGESMKKGDYHNDFMVDVELNQTETSKKDLSIKITYYAYESLAPSGRIVLSGSAVFPKTGVYTNVPEGSCLRITLKHNVAIMCIRAPCIVPTIASNKITDLKFDGNKIHFAFNTKKLDQSMYVMRAFLNLGWCPDYDEDYPADKWLKDEDYYTEGEQNNVFEIKEKDDRKIISMDIKMRYNKKYMCGEKRCYNTERCERFTYYENYGKYLCQCPMAARCSSKIDWFCGSDGKSYMNSCMKDNEDCFSNTIKKEYDGKCSAFGGHKGFFKENSNRIGFGVGIAVFTLLVILIAVFLAIKYRHRAQQKTLTRAGTFSKQPIVMSNSFHEPDPIYETVNDNAVVDLKDGEKKGGEPKEERAQNHYVMDTPPVAISGPPPAYEDVSSA